METPINYATRIGDRPRSGHALVSCHFHPPETVLMPSGNDLASSNRHNSRQSNSGIQIVDIVGLALSNGNIDLLLLQQTQADIQRPVYLYLEDPKEFFVPNIIFDHLLQTAIERTSSQLFPDDDNQAHEFISNVNLSDLPKFASKLPANYLDVFIKELEATGFYKASTRVVIKTQ